MRIIIDAMGGDNAPLDVLEGAVAASQTCNAELILIGDEEVIHHLAAERGLDLGGLTLLHAPAVITMEDDPIGVLRSKKDSSMLMGMRLLAEGGADAFVSAGNTGALFAGATFIVKRAKGVERAAIGTILPGTEPCLLLDAGANLTVSEEHLEQFARMGTAYMQSVYGIDSPKVGLLNNGTEDTKGTPLRVAANRRLAECRDICYVGNVEGSAVLLGACHILVTDGFTGNILLKTVEGTCKMLMQSLKSLYTRNTAAKLSALVVKKSFTEMKKTYDPSEQGGSPILGIAKPVIKAHGSSDVRAFKNAILAAIRYAESGAGEAIERALAKENRSSVDERKAL